MPTADFRKGHGLGCLPSETPHHRRRSLTAVLPALDPGTPVERKLDLPTHYPLVKIPYRTIELLAERGGEFAVITDR